jgi:hypothetical protein
VRRRGFFVLNELLHQTLVVLGDDEPTPLLHQALIALSDDEPVLRLAVAMPVFVGEEARRGREELRPLEGLNLQEVEVTP